ncbi:MAG TPA: EscU/YscU/HrcU family type III secretion system export apparatus switch protein [Alcaligenes sp.]|nr:EscU/YscU/HrcU family type III secretion system export apparatus switch protein [Alcaligenes sp.]HRL25956.1 EscU/YscU/HrcU family type III secretion system export apparatus switch protein [Alcaligenes sp.]
MPADQSTHRPQAIALRYDPQDSAPRVVAKGYGTLAENILRTAREHGLYVHESPELVGLLMQVDLDRHVPPQLYQAVAELLAWLYALEQGHPKAKSALQALEKDTTPDRPVP